MSFQKIIKNRPSGTTRGFTLIELLKVPGQPEVATPGAKSAAQAGK